MSGFSLQGLGDRGRVDSHIGSVPPKRSWKRMLITLPCARVKTPKSAREVKSDNISSPSPRPCSAARFAPLLSLCCLLPRPHKVSSKRLATGLNPCYSGPSQCHIAWLLSLICLVICALGEPPFTSARGLNKLQVDAWCR